MSDWLEARGSDLLIFVWLFLSFGVMVVLTQLGYALAGQIAYFAILIFGIFGTEIYIREMVNKYPYILAIVRPSNKRLHLFIKSGVSRRVGDVNVADLELAFPVNYADYGKVKRIKLHYYGDWSKRVEFRPGYASFYGYEVSHPQTEVIEVYQVSRGRVSVDHGTPIPVFFLHSASRDAFLEKYALTPPAISSNPGVDVEALMARIKTLEAELAVARQKIAEWQQLALSYEDIIEQQKAEIKGLLEAKTGVKELAQEYLLTLYQAAGSIEAALRHIRGPRLPVFSKYLAMTLIGALVIAYLWANPQVVQQVMYFLQTPSGMILGVIVVAVLGYIVYRAVVRKR